MDKNDQQANFVSQNPDIYDNTTREVILVMPDTLDNKLRDFEDGIKSKGSLFNDFALIIAFLGTIVTVSEFKNFLGIPGNVWQALFILFLIISGFKLIRDIFFNYKKSISREDIIEATIGSVEKKKQRRSKITSKRRVTICPHGVI